MLASVESKLSMDDFKSLGPVQHETYGIVESVVVHGVIGDDVSLGLWNKRNLDKLDSLGVQQRYKI